MADVAFMGDDEDFNIGYDSLDQLEQFEQRREQLLEEEKMRVQPYIRDYFLNVPSTEQAEIFTEMILYISNAQQYNWIYNRIYKIANDYLTNAQLRFNLQEREIGIIAYVHSNTLADKAIEYAKDILLAAHERYEYIENRPPPQEPRSGIEPDDYSDNRIPWQNMRWEPVTILEKEILVYRRHLIAADHITLPDEIKVKDSNGVDYGISRWNLNRYPTNEEDGVKVTLIEQRTWIFVSWNDNPRDHLYFSPNSPNTEDYIIVKRVFHDDNTMCRIFFADRKQAIDGAFKNYPHPPPEEEEEYEIVAPPEEEEEEEEEGEVVAPIPAPPRRVVRRNPEPQIREFDIKLPSRIANLIITDAVNKQEMCSITFDVLTRENVLITSCFHLFVKTALQEWTKTSTACPLCRERMTWVWFN